MARSTPAIVATSDGSATSARVFPHASALARASGLPLVVLRVLAPPQVDEQLHPSDDPAIHRDAVRARADLERQIDVLEPPVDLVIERRRQDEPVQSAIMRLATTMGGLTLAMASRGADSVVRQALLGSVTLGIVRDSHLPVLIAGSAVDRVPSFHRYTILCLCDDTPGSANILRALGPLLTRLSVDVIIARVDPHATQPLLPARREALLADVEPLGSLLPPGTPVRFVIESRGRGTVAARILKLAEELGVQAIGMASGGHSVLKRLGGGSLAADILRLSPIPLILTHPD